MEALNLQIQFSFTDMMSSVNSLEEMLLQAIEDIHHRGAVAFCNEKADSPPSHFVISQSYVRIV